MIHRLTFIWAAILAIILAGCWDQRLLKDHSLVLAIGYDKGNDEKLIKTVTLPKNNSGVSQQNTTSNESKVLSTTGDTVKDAENKMDQSISEKFDRSKTKVILLGERMASQGIFSTLDSIYRDLRGPLIAKMAVFDGKAKDALSVKTDDSMLVSDVYSELLDSAEEQGITKNENVQTACPIILSKGKDLVLPYISLQREKNVPKVEGLALFNGDRVTGKLNIKETSMFLILSDQNTKGIILNLKVRNDQKKHDKNFVNIAVRHNKRKVKVNANKGHIDAKVNVHLEVEVDEYPIDHLNKEKEVKALAKRIENRLNKLAKKTLAKIQEANNDSLGLGERVKAYHHSTWEKTDWKEVYPEIPIEARFNVEIVRHGIIN
ncbi:Ger(x)C family spore germination protein [Siminovitchia fortis]|uniref:Ger(X)C family spore germination protein n=1 Tax=Siminovitchia fortis TaxID=254758 RepID=A0A443IU82_9BACI|nr:Ger(x)C family spore germination protein [Siminovitchia fortis]RWR11646.1 Ger(x)C family spore germination protein [Siminovitchia fortis]WHY83226.1 Ger(x)C family spore germination protein [Siminovitchia fortis]